MYRVVVFLAMVVGSHTSLLQVLKGGTYRRSYLHSREQDHTEEWQKFISPLMPAPELASIIQSPDNCKASSDGPLGSRSISPWSYELDRDVNRFPQDLYHARCLCPHCVSLQTGSDINPLGNSEPLYHNQTVFYRRECPGEHGSRHSYCLEPRLYRVSLACVCVRPRVAA